jgi:flagellar basal-body rod protein FlgB
MSNSLFSDNAIRAAKMALDGLSMRQQLISRNIANIDTPGYRSQEVDFEQAIQRATRNTGSVQLTATNAGHIGAPTSKAFYQPQDRPGGIARADGNTVDIDSELIEMSEAGIQYQAVSQAVSKKLLLLKTIATSR